VTILLRQFVATMSLVVAFFVTLAIALGNYGSARTTMGGTVLGVIWLLASGGVKGAMHRGLFLRWLNVLAIAAWGAFFLYCGLHPTAQAAVSFQTTIILAAWFYGWPIIDLLDLCIPAHVWERPQSTV